MQFRMNIAWQYRMNTAKSRNSYIETSVILHRINIAMQY